MAIIDKPKLLGSVPSAVVTAGTVSLQALYDPFTNVFRMIFTLVGASITVTDAGAGGASGSLKLFDFNLAAINVLGCRQNYTAFAEGSALTTAAGDAAFVMGVGSAAANAGDGVLTGTEVDIGSVTSTLTNSGGTTTGTKVSGALGVIDGTSTATDIYLNWCGTAATIDASSTIAVTGTIEISGVLLGTNNR
jgi:hypothetical protein